MGSVKVTSVWSFFSEIMHERQEKLSKNGRPIFIFLISLSIVWHIVCAYKNRIVSNRKEIKIKQRNHKKESARKMSERNGNVLMHNSAQKLPHRTAQHTKEDVANRLEKNMFISPMCITIFDLTRRRKKERQTNTALAKNGKRVREKQYVNVSLKIIAIILICIRSMATSQPRCFKKYLSTCLC